MRIHVTGHRSLIVQVIELLINNWNKLMERDSYFADLCIGCEVNVHGSHNDAETCHKSALEGKILQWHHWFVMTSCIKVSKQHNFHWVRLKADMFTSYVKKCFKCLQLVNCDQFSSCKYARNCNSRRPTIDNTLRHFAEVYETLISCRP